MAITSRNRGWGSARAAAGRRLAVPVAVLAFALLAAGPSAALGGPPTASPGLEGMTAMFAQASYEPGQIARLNVVADAGRITIQPLSVGSAPWARSPSIFGDRPVAPPRTIAWRPGAGAVYLRIGRWPSGVYFMRVRGGQGAVVAPVVVRPKRLGEARVAVIIPTFSWQAYNRRDGDTWYACPCVHTVDLGRPYLDSGVPYNFNQYDRGFLRWLARNHVRADVLSDQDLDGITSGAELRHLYRMIVFEGHGEYVTRHIYDITEEYRDAGGHLAFLSANDFFREVVVGGNAMTLIGRWRDLGRPEAALIGSQYIDWFRNLYPNRQYIVTGEKKVPWLFAGTGLRNGSPIEGEFGIEIDGLAPSSPPQTIVVADIPDIFPGETAQMTYYATRAGAEVFNAGTINFGGAAFLPDVSLMLRNLWVHMAGSATA